MYYVGGRHGTNHSAAQFPWICGVSVYAIYVVKFSLVIKHQHQYKNNATSIMKHPVSESN